MPGQHAILSASGASRWMQCPPSARMEAMFPEENTIFSEEGTFAHSVGELMIRYKLGWINTIDYHEALAVLKEDKYYSTELLDHCENYALYAVEQFNMHPKSKAYVESRLDMSAWVPEGFGTGDFILLRPTVKELYFLDLKFGKGVPVYAEENEQLMLYALGAYAKYGWIYDFEKITVCIYQPRIDNISTWSITVEKLLEWAEMELKPIAAIAFAGKGEFKAGEHCKFCKIKPTCRALKDYNLELLKGRFDEDGELKPGPLLKASEIVEVLKKAKIFTDWIGAVEEFAFDEAVKNGKKWPGFKLVRGISRRSYTDKNAVIERLRGKGYKDEKIFAPAEVRGITDLSTTIGKTDFNKYLHDLIVKPKGAPALVPVIDPRPEINSFEETKKLFDELE